MIDYPSAADARHFANGLGFTVQGNNTMEDTMEKNIYKVADGEATMILAAGQTVASLTYAGSLEFDGRNSVLALARDGEEALLIALKYDHGELQYDNVDWHGTTLAVLRMPSQD